MYTSGDWEENPIQYVQRHGLGYMSLHVTCICISARAPSLRLPLKPKVATHSKQEPLTVEDDKKFV